MLRQPKEAHALALFYKLPQDLAARTDLTSSAKLVFGVICWRIGANTECWAGLRRIASDLGMDRDTAGAAVDSLEAAGLLIVERPGRGKSSRYQLAAQSGGRIPTVAESNRKGKCRKNSARGVGKTPPQVAEKPRPNQIEALNQKGKPASPAASEAPKTSKAEPQGNGAAGRLVALWAKESKTRGNVFGDRGKVSGLLASMLAAGYTEAVLSAAVGRWWGADRPDYGIALFKAKVDGGNRELVGRPAARPDPAALKRSASSADMLAEAIGVES